MLYFYFFLSTSFFKSLYIIIFFVFSYYFLFLFILLFYQEYKAISNRDTKISFKPIYTNTGQFLIPLDYKIFSKLKTMFKLFCFISFFIFGIFYLRYSNLGHKLNVYLGIKTYLTFPFLYKILLSIIIILLFIAISFIWRLLYFYFKKETLKTYIYLYQFGGDLDSNSDYYLNISNNNEFYKRESYINKFLLDPLYKTSLLNLKMFVYLVTEKYAENNKKIFDIRSTLKELPILVVIINYFLNFSKFKNTKIRNKIVYYLKQLAIDMPIIFYWFPYIILIITIIYEITFNRGILQNMYYILLFVFLYKLYYNLASFRYYCFDTLSLKALCIYYYKLDDIQLKNPYGENLRFFYQVLSTKEIYNDLIGLIYCEFDGRKQFSLLPESKRLKKSDLNAWINKKKETIIRSKYIKSILRIINTAMTKFANI
jgi:hypothetical protein